MTTNRNFGIVVRQGKHFETVVPVADIGWDELKQSIGQVNDFRKDVANKAADFACGIYRNYPNWAKGTGPAKDILDGLWSDLCAPRGPLPQATPPFTGGQCSGVQYNCSGTVALHRPSNGSLIRVDQWSAPAFGRITGISIETPSPSNPDSTAVVVRYIDSSGNPAYSIGLGASKEITELRNLTINPIVRADGAPDNCGDLPTAYPDTGVPPTLAGAITVPLPTGIIPTFPVSLVGVNIDAGITVNVGGVNLAFNFDGVSFSPRFGVDFGGDSDNGVDSPSPSSPSHLPPNGSNYDEGDSPPGSSGEEDGIPGLKWVEIVLSQVPVNAKKQWGVNAPDVHYAGWFEWRASGKCLVREPISFLSSIYPAPDGVDGYAFTLQSGYEGYAKTYTEK